MEPQIQYTRTDDGVSIAYTSMGAGPPVLYSPGHHLSMQSMLSDTSQDVWVGRGLGACTRLTTFDHAGIGASQRDVSDFSLDAQVRAIEAVAARLADDQFTLVSYSAGAASAALYATRHHGRVKELACVLPVLPAAERIAAEMRENWSLARRRFAGWAYPEGPVSSQRWYSNAMRESMTAEVAAAYLEEFARADLKEIYRRVPVPTLLVVAAEGPRREEALALAAVVPDCRVAVSSRNDRGVVSPILAFMGIDAAQVNASAAPSRDARATSTILFTDLVDHTRMMQRLGDEAGRAVLREHERITRDVLSRHGGTEVKTDGDSFMASFTSATSGVECAVALQRAFAAHNASAAEPIHVRAGLNIGEPIEEGGDYFGSAVILAARIKDQAGAGEILVPEAVRHLLSGKNFVYADRGEVSLKGFEDAVRLYEVRWEQ